LKRSPETAQEMFSRALADTVREYGEGDRRAGQAPQVRVSGAK
jgi:hypothetical protein